MKGIEALLVNDASREYRVQSNGPLPIIPGLQMSWQKVHMQQKEKVVSEPLEHNGGVMIVGGFGVASLCR